MIVFGKGNYKEYTLTNVTYKTFAVTSTLWAKFAITFVKAPLFVVTDFVLLNKVFFYRVSDIVEVVDAVDGWMRLPTEERIQLDEVAAVKLHRELIDSATFTDARGLKFSGAISDSVTGALGGMRAVLNPREFDNVNTHHDAQRLDIAISLRDFVGLNESIRAGHSMYAAVNNTAIAIDTMRWDYTDSKPLDVAGVSEEFRVRMRPYAPSVLGLFKLGQSMLGE